MRALYGMVSMAIPTRSKEERTVNSVTALPKSVYLLGSKWVAMRQNFGFGEVTSK